MNKSLLFLVVAGMAFIAAACDSGEPSPAVIDAEAVALQTAAKPKKVYFFAPELDEKTCRATGGCDCCSSHLIFTEGNRFIFIDYCMMDEVYSKGTYAMKNDRLELTFDKLHVDRTFDEAASADQKAPEKYTMRKVRDKSAHSISLERLECNGQTIFRMTSGEKLYGTVDPETDSRELTEYMRKEGVWIQMELN